ncbi:MAG: 4Fe-4S dicluster domain-containing protein [Bacteroidota bacterium]
MHVLDKPGLSALFDALKAKDYTIIAPTVREGAIVYDEVAGPGELPEGWTAVQEPGTYRLEKRGDAALFGYAVAPNSWKKFLYPPRLRLFSARKNGKGMGFERDSAGAAKYAFIGVRPCELQAVRIQDRVFQSDQYADPGYRAVREKAFVVAVNCGVPASVCFCTSMGTGPRASGGYDLALTEILDDRLHYFYCETGSEAGKALLARLPHREAELPDKKRADAVIREAEEAMGGKLETEGLPQVLAENASHPHWDEVARRCLACANCTMSCPTCFCSTVEDVTDLGGGRAERIRRWDSCFTLDFAKVAGGNFRPSMRARYRQWLTHKFSSWVEQFGTFGCVGCGRCITWCPVGIDVRAEIEAIRTTHVPTGSSKGG